MMTAGTARARATCTMLLWLAFLGCVLAGLHGIGGALTSPPLTDPGRLIGWFEERHPAEAAFALLRLAGLVMATYLAAIIVLGAVARLLRMPTMIRAADLLTLPSVRRLANAAAGVSVTAVTLTTSPLLASAGAGTTHQPDTEAVALRARAGTPPLPEEPLGAETDEVDPGSNDEASRGTGDRGGDDGHLQEPALPTLRRLPDGAAASQPGRQDQGNPLNAPTPAEPTPGPQPEPPMDRWEVRPGQHFWAVAEKVLAAAWQRDPSDDEVDPYWRRLVAANRSILRVPDDPDLLYPGQVITVPPVPPEARPGLPGGQSAQ